MNEYRELDSGDRAIRGECARQNQSLTGLRAHLREAVAAALQAANAPGAAVALVTDGERVLKVGVGHRDLDHRHQLDADALFYAYSITKVFLAVAALRLVEQERLDLDDPIQTTLPEAPFAEPLTIRQLLNHTGGLPDYGGMAEYGHDLRSDPGRPWTTHEFLQRTLRRGFLFPPGGGWDYSNVGFILIRQAIERITQRSLGDALAELVFHPAGLHRTVVAESLEDAQILTPGHSAELDDDGGLRDMSRRYHPCWVSHGVAMTSATDLARAVEALFRGQLLAPGSLVEMLDAVPVSTEHPLFARPGYGLGLMIDLGSTYGRVAGHAGGGPGYSTAAFHFPDVVGHRITSVALVNRDCPDLGTEIAFALVAAYADHVG